MKPPVFEAKFDLKTGAHTITDDVLGTREIPAGVINVIRDQLEYLREIQRRGTSPRPGRLKDDILAYELLLAQPLASEACETFLRLISEARETSFGRKHVTKKQILMKMGLWPAGGAA